MNSRVVKVVLNNNKVLFALITDNLKENNILNKSVIISNEKNEFFGNTISNIFEIDSNKIGKAIYKVERITSKKDIKINQNNINDEKKALKDAKKIAKDLGLNMKILSSQFSFNRTQLLFSFTSDDRVDFRELAKKLASIYKTRIELRQIGVRDKAKEVGGLGPCGRFLCCSLFLKDFESVSINMAKNQFISLKPDKINGICGRLLCCLKYEDEQYSTLKKSFPKINSIIKLGNLEGKVVAINILKDTFTIERNDKSLATITLKEYESFK